MRRVATYIGSDAPQSLGLHPVVYFYGSNGRFLPMTFLAVAAFVKFLESMDAFFNFTKVRSQFEDFLLVHRDFVNQIGHEIYGGDKRVK